MEWTRRSVLASGLVAAAAGRSGWAWATVDLAGGLRLDSVSDGNLSLPTEMILGPMPQQEARAILATHGLDGDTLSPPCNVTLLRDADRTVLFDCGAGAAFQPGVGQLLDALETLDVTPDQVTDVVFTHAHPDHIWGVLDDFDDPLFPEAQHWIGREELAYWLDPATVETIGAERQSFAVGAARRLEAIADRLEVVDDGDSVLPQVKAVATPGHTPGHLAFEIGTGADRVFVVGDAIGNHHLAFARPDWLSGSDQDAVLAAQTRSALLARLADAGVPMIGYHLPKGGIGRVERDGAAYRFVPI